MLERYSSPEVLQEIYPQGLVMYHNSDEQCASQARAILSKELPLHYPLVENLEAPFVPMGLRNWITDYGAQLGNTIYGHRVFEKQLLKHLSTSTGLNPDMLKNILPPMQIGRMEDCAAENGYFVRIGGTDIVIHGLLLQEVYPILYQEGLQTIDASTIRKDIIQERETAAPKTTAIQFFSGHIDLSITGFIGNGYINIFLDEKYEQYAQGILDQFSQPVIMETVPHHLAKAGGLNIRYLETNTGWKAFVPSKKTVGKIGSRLRSEGFEIVEMGDEQVQNGGGIKCRMSVLSWRE